RACLRHLQDPGGVGGCVRRRGQRERRDAARDVAARTLLREDRRDVAIARRVAVPTSSEDGDRGRACDGGSDEKRERAYGRHRAGVIITPPRPWRFPSGAEPASARW